MDVEPEVNLVFLVVIVIVFLLSVGSLFLLFLFEREACAGTTDVFLYM